MTALFARGVLCRRGHDDGTGHSLRYRSNGACVICKRAIDAGELHVEQGRAFPESEWFARNLAMLKRIEPNRRRDYLHGVEIVRGKADALALERALKRRVPFRLSGLAVLRSLAAA